MLATLATLASCVRGPGDFAESDVPASVKGRQVKPEEKEIVDGLLRRTAGLRKNDAHPQWERLTSDDVEIINLHETGLSVASPISVGRIPVRLIEYCRKSGQRNMVLVDTEDTTIRCYQSWDVYKAIEEDIKADRLPKPDLRPAEVLDKAKAHVESMMGKLPEDLVPVAVHFYDPSDERELMTEEESMLSMPSDKGLWTVRFRRYAGRVPYHGQIVEVQLSERHGVATYTNLYLAAWGGEILVSQEEAVRAAQKHVDEYFDDLKHLSQLHGEKASLVLRRPPYIREGRPLLMHVVKDDPRAVHAVWIAVFPCASLPEEDRPGSLSWYELQVYVDAMTGEFLCLHVSSASP